MALLTIHLWFDKTLYYKYMSHVWGYGVMWDVMYKCTITPPPTDTT